MAGRRIDDAIDRLNAALRAAGFAGLEPAGDQDALRELEREIEPYALPRDLRRFWERYDLSSVRVRGWRVPELLDPPAALSTHRSNLDPEFRLMYGPPLLFPLACISADEWSIELTSEWSEGGVVFSHGTPGPIHVEYPSFLDLVEVYAELLEEGRFERRKEGWGSFALEDEREKQAARMAAAWPHPIYGSTRDVALDPARWPPHWIESAGVDLRAHEPLGATHTIAELVDASQQGPVRGRIRGEVIRLAGSSAGLLALVSDRERSLGVLCAAEGATCVPGMGRSYEFDVTVAEPIPPPADPRDVGAGADGAFLRLFEGHSFVAVATVVRPLD